MSAYTISKEEDRKIAFQTTEKLDELDLSRNPQNYELWYSFFHGKMPELNHTLNRMLESNQKITDSVCFELYTQYIDNSDQEKVLIEKTGDKIKGSLDDIQTLISDAKFSAESYGGSLNDVTKKLGKANTIEDITAVVRTILSETKTMVDKNKELETKLETSSKQIDDLQKNLEDVRKESLTDALTGIPNRKRFDEGIEDELDIAAGEGQKLCLLVIDIDYFKKFNDTYGHQVGDQVLKLVANTLVNGVKGRDLAARYGGEEFAILLPETPLSAAIKVADGLRLRIANKEIVNRATQKHLGQITISVGAAEYQPGETSEEFIKRADEALYKAKEGGRNQVASAKNPYVNIRKNV